MFNPQPEPLTLAEFDRLAPPEGEHYEVIDGCIHAFPTDTGTHGIFCTRIVTALDNDVKPPCHVFGASRSECGATSARPT